MQSLLLHRCWLVEPLVRPLADTPSGGLASGRSLRRACLWLAISPGLVLGRQSLRRAAFATSAPPPRRSWCRGWSLAVRRMAPLEGGVAPAGETRGGISAACRPVRRGMWPRRGRRRRDGGSGSSASGDPCPGRQRVAKRPSRRRRRGGPRRHTHKEARGRGLWQAWRPWGQLTSRSARCPPGAPQKKKGGVAPSGQVVSKARWAQVPKACR